MTVNLLLYHRHEWNLNSERSECSLIQWSFIIEDNFDILYNHINMQEYKIKPVPKPRMTKSDAWKERPCVVQYWAFKDKVRELGIKVNESWDHITFVLPMAKSWSKKRKKEMNWKPHQKKPDKDNLEKALLDSLFEEDKHIWDSRVSKIWWEEWKIIISKI